MPFYAIKEDDIKRSTFVVDIKPKSWELKFMDIFRKKNEKSKKIGYHQKMRVAMYCISKFVHTEYLDHNFTIACEQKLWQVKLSKVWMTSHKYFINLSRKNLCQFKIYFRGIEKQNF